MVLVSLVYISVVGVQKSVDFEGGTKLTVKFPNSEFEVGSIRDAVSKVESGATIVKLKTNQGSEFSIKIKNSDDETAAAAAEAEKVSGLSTDRLHRLQSAFAGMNSEDEQLLNLLKSTDEAALANRLMAENIYRETGTDADKAQVYQNLANKIKSNLEGKSSITDLAQAVDPDKAKILANSLSIAFPALNRTTPDLLNAHLTKYDPLGRASAGSNYSDLVAQMVSTREANQDFLPDFETAVSGLTYAEGEDGTVFENFIKANFTLGDYKIIANESFSASIAAELLGRAWGAVILALFGILLYIWMRFQMGFAIASVIALTHDVIIALGFFALVGGELSNPVVAAFLTIVGYSLNDTIVVFDRIRDNLNTTKKPVVVNLMNTSINQTLSRTIVTSLTTLFVVLVIYLFSGNETLRDFSLPLLIGIVIGTYSSIFVASPVLLLWHEKYKPISE